ncbi:MAG TPA: YfhO family protein [Acidimicrobiales bacterium]|nr:YfhO family protein [Acidimicrobiales bacterium]
MTRTRPRWAAALVVYMVVGAALLAPSIRPGRTLLEVDILEAVEPWRSLPPAPHVHVASPSDAPFQFLGWWAWTGRELRTGHVPEWNPDILGGVRVEPNGNVSTTYPLTWFDRYLAPFDGYNAFVWAHLVIAAIGVYALARRLGARFLAALIGGLGGFVVSMLVHLSTHLSHLVSISWSGLALAGTHYAVTQRRWRGVAAMGVPLAMSWLGGGTQFAYYLSLACAGYGVVLALAAGGGWRPIARAGARIGAGAALAAALAAPALIPTLAASNLILRTQEPVTSTTQTHLPSGDVFRLVLPTWRHPDGFNWGHVENVEYEVDSPFIGVGALMLAAGAIVVARRRRDVAVTVGAAAAVAVLSFVGPIHRVLYAVVPGYNHFRNSGRWISLFGWFVLPLAAVGLSALYDRARDARRAVSVAAIAIAGLATLPVVVGIVKTSVPARRFASDCAFVVVLAALVFVAANLRGRNAARAALGLATVVVLAEGVAHTTTWYGAHRESDALLPLAQLRAAAAHGRLIRYTPALTQLPPVLADVPLAYRLSDASGWAVFFPKDIDRYMNVVEQHGDFAEATNVEPPLTTAPALTSPLLDALDVTTVLVDPGITTPLPYPVVGTEGPVRILHRPNALGPATLVRGVPASDAEVWRHLKQAPQDIASVAYVQGLSQPAGGRGRVHLVHATADTQRYTVRADGTSVLRVSGRYDRGWTASVDGHRTRVLRADGVFRAVVVPSGTHTVNWRYRNPATAQGRAVGALAVLVAFGLVVVPERRPITGSDHPAI